MPTVSVPNFENEDLLSARLISFMTSNEHASVGYEPNTTTGTKYVNSNFNSSGCALNDSDVHGSNVVIRSPLHRNGSTPTMVTLQDRLLNGSPTDVLASTHSTGYVSGSCTPPPIHTLPGASGNFIPLRNHNGAPPYSALTSPCLSSKLNPGANVQQLLAYGNSAGPGECHSLQNSPFYHHYPLNGNLQNQIHRQLGGMSPGPVGTMIPNGVSSGIQNIGTPRTGLYQDTGFPMGNNFRPLNGSAAPGCPQRELFPSANPSSAPSQSVFGSGLLIQDRLHYYALAQKHGYIVGAELERVKENSCRSTSQSYGRIAAHFRHRYGETEAKTKAAYLQIGVRVPSKDHVSEIVGKGGQKIKLIREETGALITTPGEHEEHVFIIEAPPEIAMRVAHHLSTRAQEITQSKLAAGERRRGSTSSQPSSGSSGGGLDGNGISAGSFNGTGSNCPTSGSGLLAPIGGPPPSNLLSLGNSTTNSPLHPTAGALLQAGTNGALRTPNGSLYPGQMSSLPSSPCNSSSLNGLGGTGGVGGHGGQGNLNGGGSSGGAGLFITPNTPGSRILLARGRISVPQELVGKIIGTQGSIITTIQKDTGTEIKSPPKEAARGPNATSEFEISAYQGVGLSSNQAAECRVQQAKQLIGHLVMRQLERRASEEIDEASGSSNLSSDDQRMGLGGGNTPRTTTAWMWPDVAQMDSQEAREVLDRILAESKNKTRRAKELAAAAAVSAGPSPTSSGPSLSNPGNAMLGLGGAGVLGQESTTHHFRSQLMGTAGLFDQSESSECNESLVDSTGSGLFSSSNTFTHRNSSSTLVDDPQNSGLGRGQPCSPRSISGFNLHDQNDLMSTFSRAPGPSNLNADIWNPLSSIVNNTSGNSHNPTHTTDATGHLQNLISSSSTLNALFTSSPPPPLSGTDSMNGLLRKQPSLTTHNGGFSGSKHTFDESNVFNFNDLTGATNSAGFGSVGDLSPTLLMHYRSQHYHQHQQQHNQYQQPSDLLHQPLTRRHSDWVVSSANILGDLATRPGVGVGRQLSNQLPTATNRLGLGNQEASVQLSEQTSSPYNSPGGFDFLRALDQLCLNSGVDNASENGVTISHCPPGFEPLQNYPSGAIEHGLSPVKTVVADIDLSEKIVNSVGGPWSNNDASSGSLFLPPSQASRDYSGPSSFSKQSLLRSLFSDNDNVGVQSDETDPKTSTAARLNAIWSQKSGLQSDVVSSSSNQTMIAVSDEGSSFTFPYFDSTAALVDIQEEEQILPKSDACFSMNFQLVGSTGCSPSDNSSARCGAIGDGRRRRRQSPQSLSSELDSMQQSLSVPPAITSVTEVA
ncbi:hypothetical protein CRM22_011208 [Opisthorchis felineus]|uniref:K Homology domain-containing protein n=1 Tax=Opisthorchis felineus TaxID=147828 RepID=A0A4S2K5N8_OPIFE|nr:hypothetical protein CRM22_011208 [Opisthorchis felineus]